MRSKRLRFLSFRAPDGTFEVACLDAGAAGHGESLIAAVQSLIDSLIAGLEMSADPERKFFGKPSATAAAIYDAVCHNRPVPRSMLKASSFSGKVIGTGELLLVTAPTPHVDIGRLERVGA